MPTDSLSLAVTLVVWSIRLGVCPQQHVLSILKLSLMQIIGKGVPEDAMPGIKDKQVPLPDSMVHLNNMYNSTGNKVNWGLSVCWYSCEVVP